MRDVASILRLVSSTADWSSCHANDIHDRNAVGDTPLHVVCRWGDFDSVVTLIEAGADVNARGEYGMTPLFAAVDSQSAVIARLLLDSGADPSMKAQGYGTDETPLFFARLRDNGLDSELTRLLEKTQLRSSVM
jgi:uncharacterized protein